MSANSSYSNPRSGTSSPRGGSSSTTPPPAAAGADPSGPSPLMVGTRFVKQYYQVLTSDTPEQIVKFYQPSSVISSGTASEPSTTIASSSAPGRFPRNAGLRFEFEHGAIDAQATGTSGILLVVTGQFFHTLENHVEDDEEDGSLRCQAFVHTFVLNAISNAQGKRSYYVQNDILRVLNENLTAQTSDSEVSEPATGVRKEVAVVEEETVVVSNKAAIQAEEAEAASGGGVEESKDTVLDDESTKDVDGKVSEKGVPVVVVVEEPEGTPFEIPVVSDEKGQKNKNQAPAVDSGENGKAAPKSGSWASLVARAPAPSTPSKAPVVASPSKVKPVEGNAIASQALVASAQASSNVKSAVPAKPAPTAAVPVQTPINKRDPEFTLVIKNINGQTKEPDVVTLFDAFAKDSDAVIVSITVAAHKGIAFIDFSSAAPVLAIVEKHKQEAFQLHGRVLDVYQKSIEQRSRRGAGGRAPSSTGGGGRQHRGGRSERGGGRSGRSGR